MAPPRSQLMGSHWYRWSSMTPSLHGMRAIPRSARWKTGVQPASGKAHERAPQCIAPTALAVICFLTLAIAGSDAARLNPVTSTSFGTPAWFPPVHSGLVPSGINDCQQGSHRTYTKRSSPTGIATYG